MSETSPVEPKTPYSPGTSSRGKQVYPPAEQNRKVAHSGDSLEKRVALYEQSVADPAKYWSDIAKTFHWEKKWDDAKVFEYNYDKTKGKVHQEWFAGGVTNMCYNCVDRHLPEHKDTVAFFFEANEPGEASQMTYGELHTEVCKLAEGDVRRQEGRPREPVPPDDLPGADRDARVRPRRRHVLRRLRWLLRAVARRTPVGLPVEAAHHRGGHDAR